MDKLFFNFTVKKGKTDFPDIHLFRSTLKNLLDGSYTITITKTYRKRTIQQNRYYWLCVGIVAKELGFDEAEELHEAMKLKFNPKELGGMVYGGSTKNMTTKEFMEYADKVLRYFRSPDGLGMILPDPDMQFIEEYFS